MIDLTGVRILIAEDEFIIAHMLEWEIQACGGEVVGIVSRIGEAVEAARTREIDLALLDVNLRGELISLAVKDFENSDVPILLHTAYDTDDLPPDLRHIPMIRKPHKGTEICAAIHKLYRRRPA